MPMSDMTAKVDMIESVFCNAHLASIEGYFEFTHLHHDTGEKHISASDGLDLPKRENDSSEHVYQISANGQ